MDSIYKIKVDFWSDYKIKMDYKNYILLIHYNRYHNHLVTWIKIKLIKMISINIHCFKKRKINGFSNLHQILTKEKPLILFVQEQ